MKRVLFILIVLLFFAGCLVPDFSPGIFLAEETGNSYMVGDSSAMFYPSGLNSSESPYYPGFVTKPQNRGEIGAGISLKPEFFSGPEYSRVKVSIPLDCDLYGQGEVTGPLERTGQEVIFWNTDNFNYLENRGKRLYQSHPWVLGLNSDGSAFGFFPCTTAKASMIVNKGSILFTAKGRRFPVVLIEAESPEAVMKELAELTGYMDLPALWTLGYQQCRWSYYPDTRAKEVADTFREKKIPCDVIWFDIHYMDGYRVFTFDPKRYPDPVEMNDYLHERGFKSVWMIDPGVKKEEGYSVYDSGTGKNIWVQDKNGKPYVGKVWPGDCVFPDFTMDETVEWWADLYKDFMATGIDGVWNDMNEPAVFDGPDQTMPADNFHRGSKTIPADIHENYHNMYGMLMVRASRMGILAANPDKRPFILSRSNFLGGQRYAAMWTGDNQASWNNLQLSIPMSLNIGLSGQPFNGPDIGGFSPNTGKNLFARWIGVGAFMPFSRGHAAQGTNDKEPWAFDKYTEEISRVSIERRYRLLPYLYTLFREASVDGIPVMRPVFFADPADLELRKEQSAFLWGNDLLIVPELTVSGKTVHALPKGIWRELSLVGERAGEDVNLPLLKQRGGSVIALTDVVQSTADYNPDKSFELSVCPDDDCDAEGFFYEDKGEGFEYKNGAYRVVSVKARLEDNNNQKVLKVLMKVDEGAWELPDRNIKVSVLTDAGVLHGEFDAAAEAEIILK